MVEKSAIYSGIKSFVRFGDVEILVQDKESHISTIEKYENIKGVLEILLNEKQFQYFETHILANEEVFIDFNRAKILKVKPKYIQDEVSKQLSLDYINGLMDDEDEMRNHLMFI